MPTAANITVRETLDLLDGPFAELSEGVSQARYAFWLGSGISRERVDDLRRVIRKVLVHLQTRIDAADPNCPYRRALEEALALAQLSPSELGQVDPAQSVDTWGALDVVLQRLPREYSRLLDIRVQGQAADYLLWDAVDVPTTFAPAAAEPDCEHLCLGILGIEGVAPEVVSANWDGLIEAAVAQLTAGGNDVLLVCVRGEDLREPRRRSRLIKFHGCAVRAANDAATYRPLIVARLSQITQWPVDPSTAPIREQLVNLAVTNPTLMIGLSAQDTNIQHTFAAAQARMAWPWPSHPPAHVFAEDALGNDQRNILRYVYRTAYDTNGAAVEVSALLRAFAKPLFVSLVLHVAASKLTTLASLAEAPGLGPADRQNIQNGILHFRNRIADAGNGDRLTFMRSYVGLTSRALRMFREGRPADASTRVYRAFGSAPRHQIAADPAIHTSGLRELAVALGLLGLGEFDNAWHLTAGTRTDGKDGILEAQVSGHPARIYLAANADAALTLEAEAIVTENDGDAVIIHSTAPPVRQARSPRAAPGRTGAPAPRHVDMRGLLGSATGLPDLRRRFREEAVL